MTDLHLMLAMILCSLGIILVCFAISQVRAERIQLHMRVTKIEDILEKLKEQIFLKDLLNVKMD